MLQALEMFVEQSTVGEFAIRLEMILAFHCHLLHATESHRVTSVLLLLIIFLIQSSALDLHKCKMTKCICDVVQSSIFIALRCM